MLNSVSKIFIIFYFLFFSSYSTSQSLPTTQQIQIDNSFYIELKKNDVAPFNGYLFNIPAISKILASIERFEKEKEIELLANDSKNKEKYQFIIDSKDQIIKQKNKDLETIYQNNNLLNLKLKNKNYIIIGMFVSFLVIDTIIIYNLK